MEPNNSQKNPLNISKDIQTIMIQTTYTYDVAVKKMDIHKNVMTVIREFHGLPIEQKATVIEKGVSINQEIYKQIRNSLPIHHLDPT